MVVLNQIKLSTAFGYWDYLNVEKLIGRSFLLPISPLKNIGVFFKGSIAFFFILFFILHLLLKYKYNTHFRF